MLPSVEGSETILSTRVLLCVLTAGTFHEFFQKKIEHFCEMCRGEIRKAKSHLKVMFKTSIQSTLKHSSVKQLWLCRLLLISSGLIAYFKWELNVLMLEIVTG